VTPEQLEAAVKDSSWTSLLQPMDVVLSLWEKIMLSDEQVQTVRCGAGLALDSVAPELSRLRAYDRAGIFTALLKYDAASRLWRPRKVFNQAVARLKTASTP
jgi:tRNA U55 pseudouridine synthase TruB